MANLIPLAIADVELQLSTAIAVGGTTFSVSSANDDDGNALPAGLYCFTVDNGTSAKEYLLGQLNGTDVTSVKSVSRQGTNTTGAARAHRVGAPVIITNFATLQRVADILRGQLDLDGANPLIYDAEPTLADRKEIATVGYVLDTATGGTVAFDSQVIAGNGGEAIVAGNLVYFKTSDQEWYKTDADTAATVDGVQLGIALGTGSDGVSITGGIQIAGTYTTTGLTAGSTYYASNTAGAYATSAGTNEKVVGVALSTTKLLFAPKDLTQNQIDALEGTPSAPTATNKYTTQAKSVTAGATINGATTPVPVYQNKTDNEFYACDANDTAAMKFLGFAISNGTDGTSMLVQFTGIVSGFTGLSEGEKYYVQDAVGTIGTSIGTYEILVGVAISETELLVMRGKRRVAGTSNVVDIGNDGSVSDVVVTCGFRPSLITVHVYTNDAPSSDGLGPTAVLHYVNGTSYLANGGVTHVPSVLSVSDTGFTVRLTQSGSNSDGYETDMSYIAEGEL